MQPLVAEGLLALNLKTKVYTVGPTIFSFAIQGNLWCSRRELYMPAVENIALRMRDTAFFSVRSANESVCLARRNGDFPLRVMSLEKGSRRPLGDGSGSLAILAFLPDERRSEILEQCASLYERFELVSEHVVENGRRNAAGWLLIQPRSDHRGRLRARRTNPERRRRRRFRERCGDRKPNDAGSAAGDRWDHLRRDCRHFWLRTPSQSCSFSQPKQRQGPITCVSYRVFLARGSAFSRT